MKTTHTLGPLLSLCLALAPAALAHHSQSEYDSRKKVEVEGTVSKVEWKSPHAWIHIDVTNEKGEKVNWHFELPSPNTLMRRGWTRDSLKIGDKINLLGTFRGLVEKLRAKADALGSLSSLMAFKVSASQDGIAMSQATIASRRRMSTAACYLEPIRNRTNLHIETGALASCLLLEGTRCVGVRYSVNGQTREARSEIGRAHV